MKGEEEKKGKNLGQYNINIMNHSGDSNININIHNININPDSERDQAWQKHRLLSNNTRSNLEKARKLKDEMITNTQGEGTKVMTHSRNPSQVDYSKPINFGMSKFSGHARMKSDIREYQTEGGNYRRDDGPAMFYKTQFSNKN